MPGPPSTTGSRRSSRWSETVVLPVLPEIPALNSVHLLLDQLAETGPSAARRVFVLNNAFARDLLKRSDVETALGSKISADLPYDPIVYLKAVNEGNPGRPQRPQVARGRQAAGARDHRLRRRPGAGRGKAAKSEKRGLFGRR